MSMSADADIAFLNELMLVISSKETRQIKSEEGKFPYSYQEVHR
jgi:hypothetical protein